MTWTLERVRKSIEEEEKHTEENLKRKTCQNKSAANVISVVAFDLKHIFQIGEEWPPKGQSQWWRLVCKKPSGVFTTELQNRINPSERFICSQSYSKAERDLLCWLPDECGLGMFYHHGESVGHAVWQISCLMFSFFCPTENLKFSMKILLWESWCFSEV